MNEDPKVLRVLHMTDSGSDREDFRKTKRGKGHVNEYPKVLPRRSSRIVRKRKTSKASGSSSKPKAKKAKGARDAEQDESTIKGHPNVNCLTKKEYEDLRWGTNPYDRSRDPELKDDSQLHTLCQVSIHYDVILQIKKRLLHKSGLIGITSDRGSNFSESLVFVRGWA